MKSCSVCLIQKPFVEFHKKRKKPQAICKVCRSKYMSKYYQSNLERERAKRKAWYEKNKLKVSEQGKLLRKSNPEKYGLGRRLKKYRISKSEYDLKLESQNNSCEICKIPFSTTPAIDHCHETSLIRGLLCDNCNTGLGLLNEDPKIFESCIAYVIKYKK